jgi:hypothetical protein
MRHLLESIYKFLPDGLDIPDYFSENLNAEVTKHQSPLQNATKREERQLENPTPTPSIALLPTPVGGCP